MKIKITTLILAIILSGCYSFTGGSVPEHLKTITLAPIEDNSGFGFPEVQNILAIELADSFRTDNSLQIVDAGGDAILTVRISSISDQTTSAGAGELETEKRLTISLNADYYDNVKQKDIFKNQSFSNYLNYDINNAQANRNEAAREILEQLSNDILLAVISGW